MPTTTNPESTTSDALVIDREFDAPLELVWKAWSDPDPFMKWWGPKEFTAPSATIDFRVGGTWLACMRSGEGQDFWATGVYREIVPMKRIVATDSFADAEGNIVPATHYGMGDNVPLEMLMTITFEEVGGKTKMRLVHEGLPVGDMSTGANQGWNESFDKLAATLN